MGLIDKIIDTTMNQAATIGTDVVKSANLSLNVKKLENEKKHFAELLGMKVYKIYLSGNQILHQDISNYVDEITDRLQQIELLKAKQN